MRVEALGDLKKLNLRIETAKEMFKEFPAHLPPESRAQFQEDVQVKYLPLYAYEEILATFGNSPGESENRSLLPSMERLTAHVTGFLPSEPITRFVASEYLESRRQMVLAQFEGSQVIADPTQSLIRLVDAVWAGLNPQEEEEAKRALLRLMRVAGANESAGDARLLVKLSDFDERSKPVLSRLAQTPLVVIERDPTSGEEVARLSSDDLLRWPRLLKWVSDDHEFLLWRQDLNRRIDAWGKENRIERDLLTGERLGLAKRWKDERLSDLNRNEIEYINLSISRDEGKKQRVEPLKLSRENGNIELAKRIIAGRDEDFDVMFDLAKRLKNERAFGYARRILERARDKPEAYLPEIRLKLAQQLALVTYKDPGLPQDLKLDDAFDLLRRADDLRTTKNQETLGLAGAIFKQRWENDGQLQHLHSSLAFYLRGYEQGVEGDYGHTGINAAFILDLIADQEEEEASQTNIVLQSTTDRRSKSREIREKIAETLEEMASKNFSLTRQWWFTTTIAEAYFGLEDYSQARKWLKEAAELEYVLEFERESTTRQLVQLALLQVGRMGTTTQSRQSEDWEKAEAGQVLREWLEEIYGSQHVANAAYLSARMGKIGLALSGGGFRAAFYHIGVLAALAERDMLRKVEAISCVSGGSIIGAHYYLEVRKLLSEKADQEITKEDYIGIVKRVERDFLAGVQTNIRTRVLADPWTNLMTAFAPNYSRTQRVGELYEKKIFARVEDGEGGKPRWLNELIIRPKGEAPDFRPKNDNWRRAAKVPMLILNATTLNTGHNWQFTAAWMGEPPSSIDSEVDGNYRLRRMYYDQASGDHKRIRLGHAVAASSCVAGLFEPLVLANLYQGLVVRLVDGGASDSQGATGLMDQGCNVLLVSDGAGQMNTMNDPGGGLLAVPLRTNSVLQARVRVAQYRELSAQRRSSSLRGLMFIHLKKDLKVKPLDWIDCPDPQDSRDSDSPLTKYGINKDAQERMAAIRTDLDSFSDAEARSLMISGYRMTEFEIARSLPEFDQSDGAEADWQFMKLDESLTRAEAPAPLLKLLSVAASLAFKIWRLWPPLRASAIAFGLILTGLLGWLCWENWNAPMISIGFGGPDKSLWRLTWGDSALTVTTIAAFSLLPAFARSVLRLVDYRKTGYEITVGVVMGLLGWVAAQLHLLVFDKLYLWWGSQKRLLGTQDNRSNE